MIPDYSTVSFNWKYFKGFKDTGKIEIKPITLFIGRNGTGKTSLIQPFLILGQSYQYSTSENNLKVKGVYLNGGTYKDIVHNHNLKNNITFELSFYFTPRGKKNQKLGNIPPVRGIFEFKNDNLSPVLNKIILYDELDRELLRRELKNEHSYNIKLYEDLPNIKKSDKLIKRLIQKQSPRSFIFSISKLLPSIIEFNEKNSTRNSKKNQIVISKSFLKYLNIVEFFENCVRRLIESIKYIGPLRVNSKRFYEDTGEVNKEVGLSGEHTYLVLSDLLRQRKQKIINKWLQHFQLGNSIDCKNMKGHPDLFIISIKDYFSKLEINYQDSCFGLTQLLPIIVQTLSAEKDDILVIEQPEVHLNPKLESLLAEFVVEMVKTENKKFVLETHSEYFLLRLRTLIKKGVISPKEIALYYTESTKTGNSIRKIDIDTDGRIQEDSWPIGFFEDNLIESLTYATAQKN
jgi:predicted ATPase